jgi:predicted AlkP superfamily phosphohydrolase/phosphomutase
MFQLTQEEFANLKSQIVISSWGGLRRATPYAFTESAWPALPAAGVAPKWISEKDIKTGNYKTIRR